MDVSCIVLAGGKSTRLGRNKVVEKVGDKSLLERVVTCLSSFDTDIIVVAAKESCLPQLTNFPNIKILNDIYPGKGSLGGIYTGLVASCHRYNIVVACDMPFLNINLFRYMVNIADDNDAVVPKLFNDVLEPLHAVYSRNCISAMESLINQNRLSILYLFPLIKVRYVADSEIIIFDREHLSFFNVNTEADLKTVKELVQKGDMSSDKC